MKKLISLMLFLVLMLVSSLAVRADIYWTGSGETIYTKIIDSVVYERNINNDYAEVTGIYKPTKQNRKITVLNEVKFDEFDKPFKVKTANIGSDKLNSVISEIEIQDGIKNIYGIQNSKNLKKVYFGKDVSFINPVCFANCPNVKVEFNRDNKYFIYENDRILSKNKKTLYFDFNPKKIYVIPKGIKNVWLCFNKDVVQKVVIPYNIEKIESGSGNKYLQEVKFINHATVSKSFNFSFCKKLTKVTLSNKQKFVGTLWGTGITSFKIPSSVEKIGFAAFDSTNLTTIKIPQKVIKICNQAFNNCRRLQKVTIESKTKAPKISRNAFLGAKSGIKFYTKNKKVAKQLKNNLKNSGVKKAQIYVGKKLIYKNVK